MKIDVVVGNPPYNKDIYLDFVENGHKIAGEYSCFITPAKWQAKGGDKNEHFRQEIVPHMSKIVYYPDCCEVFAIGEPDGICAYAMDKNIHNIKNIVNHAKYQRNYENEAERDFGMCISNCGYNILKKLGSYKPLSIEALNKQHRYQCWMGNKISVISQIPRTCLWGDVGMFNCIQLVRVVDSKEKNKIPDDSRLVYSSDNIINCDSFKSWVYTRFVRFFVSLSICGLTGVATNDTWWRFVPDPGKFDHIFTDQELYAKYNLTEEEIQVIESVIKERK